MPELSPELARIEDAVSSGRGRTVLPELEALLGTAGDGAAPGSPDRGLDPCQLAEAMLLRTRALLSVEDWEAAGEAADSALDAFAELENVRGVRRARLCQAQVRLFSGQPRPARFFSGEVLAGALVDGDREVQALAHYVMGCAARQLDELEASRLHLEESGRLWEELGLAWQAGAALMALGSTYARLGRRREADACFSRLQEQAEGRNAPDMLARVLNQRALLAWAALEFSTARKLLLRKLDLEAGLGLTSAATLNNLATVELHAGSFEQARRHALLCLPLLLDSPQRALLADVYSQLALADLYLGERESALSHALLAQRTIQEASRAQEGDIPAILGLVHLANGEVEEGRRQWLRRARRGESLIDQMADRQYAAVLRAMLNGGLAGPDLGGTIRATAELWLEELVK